MNLFNKTSWRSPSISFPHENKLNNNKITCVFFLRNKKMRAVWLWNALWIDKRQVLKWQETGTSANAGRWMTIELLLTFDISWGEWSKWETRVGRSGCGRRGRCRRYGMLQGRFDGQWHIRARRVEVRWWGRSGCTYGGSGSETDRRLASSSSSLVVMAATLLLIFFFTHFFLAAFKLRCAFRKRRQTPGKKRERQRSSSGRWERWSAHSTAPQAAKALSLIRSLLAPAIKKKQIPIKFTCIYNHWIDFNHYKKPKTNCKTGRSVRHRPAGAGFKVTFAWQKQQPAHSFPVTITTDLLLLLP